MERHRRYPAHVHTDCGEDAARSHTASKPLVECPALSLRARPHDLSNGGRSWQVARHRVRLHISRSGLTYQRRGDPGNLAPARFGGSILWRVHEDAGVTKHIREDSSDAG